MINEQSVVARVLPSIIAIWRSDMSERPEHARSLVGYTYIYGGEVHFEIGCQRSSPLPQPNPNLLQSGQWVTILNLPDLHDCTQQQLRGLAIQAARNILEMIEAAKNS